MRMVTGPSQVGKGHACGAGACRTGRAHLTNAAAAGACEQFYWHHRNREVDFVLRAGKSVESGRDDVQRSCHPENWRLAEP